MPANLLSEIAVAAHEAWLQRDRTGPGRLELVAFQSQLPAAQGRQLAEASLRHGTLDRHDFSTGSFKAARLERISLRNANVTACDFDGATLIDCDLGAAAMGRATLRHAVLRDCRLYSAYLNRVFFHGAQVERCRFAGVYFGTSVLDDAVFTDCDFRGADLSVDGSGSLGTTTRTRFIRCDLRDTRWAGRSLCETAFIECALHGSGGRPREVDQARFERCDASAAGDGRQLVSPQGAHALLGWASADESQQIVAALEAELAALKARQAAEAATSAAAQQQETAAAEAARLETKHAAAREEMRSRTDDLAKQFMETLNDPDFEARAAAREEEQERRIQPLLEQHHARIRAKLANVPSKIRVREHPRMYLLGLGGLREYLRARQVQHTVIPFGSSDPTGVSLLFDFGRPALESIDVHWLTTLGQVRFILQTPIVVGKLSAAQRAAVVAEVTNSNERSAFPIWTVQPHGVAATLAVFLNHEGSLSSRVFEASVARLCELRHGQFYALEIAARGK